MLVRTATAACERRGSAPPWTVPVSGSTTADVVRSGVALRINHDDLLDVLGERPELLRQMFASMFRMTEMAPAA